MIQLEEALSIVTLYAASFGDELISLEDADGRVLAEEIFADRNYPPFNRAAMDGYAIRKEDWDNGLREFLVQETIFTGQAAREPLTNGSCYKIMTGAATPSSADVIIRREDSLERDNRVVLNGEETKLYQNIAREGEDVKKGELLVKSPQFCAPPLISLLASVGKHQILVKRKPTVAVLTSGNEVISPREAVKELQIRNSNKYLLISLLKKWGITPVFTQHLPDHRETIADTLAPLLDYDIIILNGGVSAGDADFIPEVLTSLGVKKLFHKVAIRPGKPIWCGKSEGGLIFALPGNPLSCLTTFTIFVESYLYSCFGFDCRPTSSIPLTSPRTKKSNLNEFFPVRFSEQGTELLVQPFNGSGDITAGLFSDGLGFQPSEMRTINAGEKTTFFPFR